MLKIASGLRKILVVALALAAPASSAQSIVAKPGTYIDRTSEGVTASVEASQAVQAARTANEQADSREKARLDALRASLARESSEKERQRAAANLELERQMEKARQETYRYYRNAAEAHYESVRQQRPTRRDAGGTAPLEKRDAPVGNMRPGCDIRPVMTDAEIEALRRCR